VAQYFFAANGDDTTGAGTQLSPWQTLTKLNGMTLSPGDSAFLRAGDTFSGQINPAGNGTSGAVITISSYGTGRATVSGAGAPGMSLSGRTFLTISNLIFSRTGVGGQGILSGDTTSSHHITVSGCDITATGDAGIKTGALDHDWTITGNTIHDCGGDGIALFGTVNFDVNKNTISNIPSVPYHGIVSNAAGTSGTAAVRIHHNTITNCATGIEARNQYTYIYYNKVTVSTNCWHGIVYSEAATLSNGRVQIFKNIITGVNRSGGAGIYLAPTQGGGVTTMLVNMVVANNTVVCSGSSTSGIDLSAECTTSASRYQHGGQQRLLPHGRRRGHGELLRLERHRWQPRDVEDGHCRRRLVSDRQPGPYGHVRPALGLFSDRCRHELG
jgi:parallel beta-helix repeat protein